MLSLLISDIVGAARCKDQNLRGRGFAVSFPRPFDIWHSSHQ